MLFSIIFIFLITVGIGLPLTLLIAKKMNSIQRIGVSFPLGIGIFTLLMFVSNSFGVKLDGINNILLLTVAVPLIAFARKRLKIFLKDLAKFQNPHFSFLEKVTLGVLGFVVVSSIISTFYWPVNMWDAVTLYDFRAHVFVNTGLINNVWASSYYLGYPLLTSLSHTIVYLSGGNNPQFIYSLFYLSLGLTLYGSLREFIDRRLSLTFTMLLLVIPIIFGHSIIAYTNLPFTVYFGLGTLFYYIGLMKKNSGLTVLAWILVGLSIWTRSIEPFWLGIVFIAFATMLFQKKFIALLKIILALFAIFVIFAIFRGFLPKIFTIRIGSTLPFSLFNFLNFERWTLVFKYIFETIIQPWGLIFYSFVFALILTILNKMKNLFLLFFIALVFMGMLFAAIFINSFLEVSGNWLAGGDATTRLSMFMYPVLIFCIALTVGKYHN